MRLPEERAISCAEEYELAIDSWGGVLQDMEGGTGKLRLTGPSSDPMYSVIRQEIESFNSIFGFRRMSVSRSKNAEKQTPITIRQKYRSRFAPSLMRI